MHKVPMRFVMWCIDMELLLLFGCRHKITQIFFHSSASSWASTWTWESEFEGMQVKSRQLLPLLQIVHYYRQPNSKISGSMQVQQFFEQLNDWFSVCQITCILFQGSWIYCAYTNLRRAAFIRTNTASDSKKQFDNLYKNSPFHNIRPPEDPNVQNPAVVMVMTADHDNRVLPLHSLKYIATILFSK